VHDQCGILFIGACGVDSRRVAALRSLGFHVDEAADIPPTEELVAFHAVIVHGCSNGRLAMIGARLRAKPHFGRRVVIALVASAVSDRDKREVTMCGFDDTMSDTCSARDIAAHVLRLLRGYPEYRCLLRAPNGRRKAA
jgi:hypothetical protein